MKSGKISPCWDRRIMTFGSILAVPMMSNLVTSAMAAPPAFASVCTGLGVSLPVLQPLGGTLDPLLGGLTNGINLNLQQALSGKTLGIGVLDPATNTIATVPANQCNVSGNSFAVDNANGLAIGGGQITGLGGTGNAVPTAGAASAIALGNGATTATGIPNAIALGTGAQATVAGGVALGSGSVASRAAQTYVDPFTGASLTTTVGALSVGQPGQERQITNVAAGNLPTDAVNVGQLQGALAAGNQSIATIIGGGSTYNTTTGTVTNPSYTVQGTTYTTIGGALNAINSSVNGVGNQKYFQVNSSGPNAQANAPEAVAIGATAVSSGPGAVAIGNGATSTGTNSVALGAGSVDGGIANVVSVGAPGAERRIINVAAGTLAAGSTDAATGGQLYTTNTQVAALGRTSVQYETDGAGNTLSTVNLSSGQGGPVTIHNLAPGVLANDAATVGQVQAATVDTVQYTRANGVRSNTIALAGGTPGGVTISNLAAGVGPSDAVNVAQLQSYGAGMLGQSAAYTDQQVNNLAAYTKREIRQARSDASGGIALALAATGLRYDDRPGKTSISGATSYYHDQAGIAFGIGQTSEDGRYRFNAALSASPTMSNPEVGAVVGASMALN